MLRTCTQRTAAMASLLTLLLAFGGVASAEEEGCQQIDMEVTCEVTPSRTILVGDPFTARATVRNTGSFPLENVKLTLTGDEGVTYTGAGDLVLEIPKLAVGESKILEGQFVSNNTGEHRIRAHAIGSQGWAAAGCYCGILVKGLPAIQVEMVDVDIERGKKGIFEVGESFIYTLTVENDVGTAVTPDLRIKWRLPPELEFVSGLGDRGVTVTGEGQTAGSSSFVLAPNKVQNFELTVRVVSVPPSNLVQTEALVVTDSGEQVLAKETESTTLKNRG